MGRGFRALCAMVAAMEFGFMGGSMGSAVGEKITRAIERCLDRKLPLVVVSASGGARMQEGILSLMQMPRTTIASKSTPTALTTDALPNNAVSNLREPLTSSASSSARAWSR